jgi:alkylated DNA repair dioxygenase AlkB
VDLFDEVDGEPHNLLPFDGRVLYYGRVVSSHEADRYLSDLLENIAWKHDEVVIHGKRIVTRRKIAWHGDKAFAYSYSNSTRYASPWNATLLALKAIVEQQTGYCYNACLLNLYHSGDEGMAWHSDDEVELVPQGAIASLSFGAERKFAFRHKASRKATSVILEHGSVLVMAGATQTYWQHSLPASRQVRQPRINLTFRCMRDG